MKESNKMNCFAYEAGKCMVLTVTKCKPSCKFYKSKAVHKAGRDASIKRCRSLEICHNCKYSGKACKLSEEI